MRHLGLALACGLILGNSIFAVVALRNFRRADEWVAHTQQVLAALVDVRASIQRADIAERDFRQTGVDRFIDTFRRAAEQIAVQQALLHRLLADDVEQNRRLTAAVAASAGHLARLEEGFSRAREPNVDATPAVLSARQESLEQIRGAFTELQGVEQRLLQQRIATASHQASVVQAVQIIAVCGTLLLIGVLIYRMRTAVAGHERDVRQRTAELENANATLRLSTGELGSREALLRSLVEATPAGIAIFDREMRYIAVSRRFREDHQLGDQPLVGRSHYEVFPDLPERWKVIHRNCLAGATAQSDEEQWRRPDGRIEWERWAIHPWHDATGAIGGITQVGEIITARKQAELALMETERQLRQAQKMETVGQLTGGVAHDFNNLLGVIIGNVEFLRDRMAGDPEQSALATEILNTALQGADLTRRLLAFARKQTLQPRPIDLRELVPNLAAMLVRTLGESITITTRLSGAHWLALADPAQVGEALLNLAINARDAMPDGGNLLIEATTATLDASYIAHNAEATPGDHVVLSVTDTGSGMSADVIERAMEPFFTTKGVGRGTGLGLSMVHGFARQSGGHLAILSELGIGTTVRLYLPRAIVPPALESVPVPAAPVAAGSNESILLVDDNVPMRNVTQRHLNALGYRVVTADSGPAALAILRSDDVFDLLFTDVVMPGGMTGYGLAEAAMKLRPNLKVLFTSGYAAGIGDAGVQAETHQVLLKPYVRAELAGQVRAALGTPG